MGNAILTKTQFESFADSMAKQYQLMMAVVGVAAEANTFNKGATNVRDDLTTAVTGDANLWLGADLSDAADTYVGNTAMNTYFMQPALDFLRAIERHLAKRNSAYSDINAFLLDQGIRLHPYVRKIYSSISPRFVWPLTAETTTGTPDAGNEVPALGSFAVTGADTGTFTAGTAINTALYGDTLVKVKVTSAEITSTNDISCIIIGNDQTGALVQATVTIPATAVQNDTVNVATVRFASVTSCTITNGANGDAWSIIARDDRTPTL